MTTVKCLAVVALLVGSASLAMAQNGPATGGEPPVGGGAAGGPPGPGMIPNDARGPALQSTASTARQATRQHRRMYMQGDVHRGTKVTGSASNTRKFLKTRIPSDRRQNDSVAPDGATPL